MINKNYPKIYIGTSGWHYQHWNGSFYPQLITSSNWLDYYASRLRSVEINNSFYQLPSLESVKKWRDTVPDTFLFALKASRYITHRKKLRDPELILSNFIDRAKILGEKLGIILFQLPPRWQCNPKRLRDFIAALPQQYRYAFEFRDRSWFNPNVYEILAEYEIAFCIYELNGYVSPKVVTTDFVYLGLHGPDEAYKGQYNTATLSRSRWASTFLAWKQEGKEIYCYFDNDECGYAAQDTLNLQSMINSHSSHSVIPQSGQNNPANHRQYNVLNAKPRSARD